MQAGVSKDSSANSTASRAAPRVSSTCFRYLAMADGVYHSHEAALTEESPFVRRGALPELELSAPGVIVTGEEPFCAQPATSEALESLRYG